MPKYSPRLPPEITLITTTHPIVFRNPPHLTNSHPVRENAVALVELNPQLRFSKFIDPLLTPVAAGSLDNITASVAQLTSNPVLSLDSPSAAVRRSQVAARDTFLQ